MSKIVQFQQNIDFYLDRAEAAYESGDYAGACELYLKALSCDPADLDSCLGYGECLNALHRFEQSNRFLMVNASMHGGDAELYYGISSNFLMQLDIGYAKDFLDFCEAEDRNAGLIPEIEDLRALLEDHGQILAAMELDPSLTEEDLYVLSMADSLTVSQDYKGAISLCAKHLKKHKNILPVMNKLAAAYLCNGQDQKAMECLDRILFLDADNLTAACTKALICSMYKSQDEALKLILPLESKVLTDLGLILSLAAVEIQLGRFEEALKVLSLADPAEAYVPLLAHRRAYALYMTGKADEAKEIYRDLLRIDPEDTVARYYLQICSEDHRDLHERFFSPVYAVPVGEMACRMRDIRAFLSLSKCKRQEQYEEDPLLHGLLCWGMLNCDRKLAERIIHFFRNDYVRDREIVLRDYLLRKEAPLLLKEKAADILFELTQCASFPVYKDGDLCEITPKPEFSLSPNGGSPSTGVPSKETVTDLTDDRTALGMLSELLLSDFLKTCKNKGLKISKDQYPALQAAMYYYALNAAEIPADIPQILQQFEITERKFENAVRKLNTIIRDVL